MLDAVPTGSTLGRPGWQRGEKRTNDGSALEGSGDVGARNVARADRILRSARRRMVPSSIIDGAGMRPMETRRAVSA